MMFELESFSPLIGTKFKLETSAGVLELQLDSAEELPRRNRPAQFRTPLLLIFSGPAEWQLAQDNYWLEHPSVGRQCWCLTPAMPALSAQSQGANQHYYQVLFN